jgi:hypothetical protein
MTDRKPIWLSGPFVDLALIDFSWVPVFVVYLVAVSTRVIYFKCDAQTLEYCPVPVYSVIAVTIFVTLVHRHFTFLLAFADRAERLRHRALYTATPLIALALAPTAAHKILEPGPLRTGLLGVYVALLISTSFWNLWHVLRQKYGFLRIYSAKLGHGDARIEMNLFFSWISVVIAGTAAAYAPHALKIIDKGPEEIQFLKNYVDWFRPGGLAALGPALLYAAVCTGLWLRTELRNISRASVPKLVFAASVALILATFAQSVLAGVLVLSFSHAFEYTAFVNLYVRHKYGDRAPEARLLGRWARHPILANVLIAAPFFALTLLGNLPSVRPWSVLMAYAVFTSIVHFTFDAVLWRVRQPESRQVLTGM